MAAIVRKGDTGDDVKAVQAELTELGYDHGKNDGIFGPKTEAAVKRVQKDNGLTEDGIVGPDTRAALSQPGGDEALLREGDRSAAVREVQTILSRHHFDVGRVDGVFGPQLAAAIKVLQDKHGLDVDGIVGPKTWRAIRSL